MSLRMLADARSGEQHGGVKKGTVIHGAKKKLNLYSRSQSMFNGLRRIRCVTDDSTHSTEETMITVFGTETGQGCLGTIQKIPSVKFVSPFDYSLGESVETICARREQDRLSSYRYLTALSHQLEVISSQSLTLDSFRAPREVCLAPLCPANQRFHFIRSLMGMNARLW